MPNGRLSLPQALAGAGLGEIRGNLEYVRIIRSLSVTRGELLVVDVKETLKGDSLPFPLEEGDIVYVPRSAVGNWNEALKELLPTLQAFSAILQPFVQIEVLTDED
jgi:polysaccharide export outer membrane protein